MKQQSDRGTVNYQQMPVIHQQVAGIDRTGGPDRL